MKALIFVEVFYVPGTLLSGCYLVQFSQPCNVGGIISILNMRRLRLKISNLPRSHRNVLKKILKKKLMSNSRHCYFHCVGLLMKSHLYLVVMLVVVLIVLILS